MRVLVITQYFAPEVTAGRFRLEAFVAGLLRGQHIVDVVCPVPNHPGGVVRSQYRDRLWFDERSAGLTVRRIGIYVRPEKTTRGRLGTYGSFAAGAVLAGATMPRPDIVFASSPPLTVGSSGLALAARFRRPLVFDVRDLWPASVAALGEVSNPRLIRAAQRLERRIYRRSKLIVTANDAFSAYVRDHAPSGREVVTVPNGTTRAWIEAGERTVERAGVGLPEDRFVLAYAGNLGLAQCVDDAIEAIRRLGAGFHLEIMGDGPRRAMLAARAEEVSPGSVNMRGLVQPEEAARVLRASDALLVAERQDRTVSAKLYDYSAIGRPIVAVAQGELRRIVEQEGIGLHVPIGNPDALAAALATLANDATVGERLVVRSRSFAAAHLRSDQADRLAVLLARVGGSAGAR